MTGAGAWEWAATGTVWRIHHDGCVDEETARGAADLVEADEARWSRFRAASETSALTEAAGRYVPVSAETLDLLDACRDWRRRTHGAFDPLVGAALAAWGYAAGLQDAAPGTAAAPAPAPVRGDVEIDRAAGAARIPRGTRLDLAGIAKGWMADRLAAWLREAAPRGRLLVDAGGDLVAARGDHVVALAAGAAGRTTLREREGIATTDPRGRRWRNGDGSVAHHLIDPRRGAPAASSAVVTVVAESCAAADVLAKAVALDPSLVDELTVAARIVSDRTEATSARWRLLAA